MVGYYHYCKFCYAYYLCHYVHQSSRSFSPTREISLLVQYATELTLVQYATVLTLVQYATILTLVQYATVLALVVLIVIIKTPGSESTSQVEEKYDSSMTATSALTIEVRDINDSPPQFLQVLYSVTATEHSSEGSVLLELTATDTDLVIIDYLPRSTYQSAPRRTTLD